MVSYLMQLLKYIWHDVIETMQYLPVGLFIFLIIFAVGTIFSKRRQVTKISLALLSGYVIILCFITFLSREPGARDGMDLIPLATTGNGPQGDTYVLENVLLFIPLGILLPSVFKNMKSVWHGTAAGFLISIAIEISQYITKRGYVQTDDVIMNTLGCALGYMIYRRVCGILKFNESEGAYEKNQTN